MLDKINFGLYNAIIRYETRSIILRKGHGMNSFGATISSHRKANRLSQAELATRLSDFGFSPSAASVSAWEKGVNIPNALQFLSVCRILGITDIYEEFIGPLPENDLSKLNEAGKEKVREYISLLLLSDEFRKPTVTQISPSLDLVGEELSYRFSDVTYSEPHRAKLDSVGEEPFTRDAVRRKLRIYMLPASAGTGQFLDGEDYEEIDAPDNTPETADFGIRVKGNSMEPRYHDGQIAWIKKCDVLENGDIGIFCLNGEAFIKKFASYPGGAALVSLNPAYSPIELNESDSFTILGKVLN